MIPLRNFFFSCYWLFPFTSGKVTWAMSNVKSHDGLSISLCHLSENECSEKVSENFKMIKLFIVKNLLSVIIFGGINYSSVNIFVTWQKNSSPFTDKVFTDNLSERIYRNKCKLWHDDNKCKTYE